MWPATSPWASCCTVEAASADGASTRQSTLPCCSSTQYRAGSPRPTCPGLQIRHVGLGHVLGGHAAVNGVRVHGQRHGVSSVASRRPYDDRTRTRIGNGSPDSALASLDSCRASQSEPDGCILRHMPRDQFAAPSVWLIRASRRSFGSRRPDRQRLPGLLAVFPSLPGCAPAPGGLPLRRRPALMVCRACRVLRIPCRACRALRIHGGRPDDLWRWLPHPAGMIIWSWPADSAPGSQDVTLSARCGSFQPGRTKWHVYPSG
jgi:hypothetical protein